MQNSKPSLLPIPSDAASEALGKVKTFQDLGSFGKCMRRLEAMYVSADLYKVCTDKCRQLS